MQRPPARERLENRPAPRPTPRPRPTPAQVRASRIQAQQYRSQAGAVRRAAKTQKTLGPGKAVRPKGEVLHERDVQRAKKAEAVKAVERGYAYTPKVTHINVAPVPKALEKAKKAGLLERDPQKLKQMGFHKAGLADKLLAAPTQAVGNIPKDVAELAVTTPSSVAHLATTAVTHPKKLPRELIAPYKELAKDPIGFATKHPVTTYLMVAPGVKAPLRGAGKVARVAGKQSLVRSTAQLPGTALKEVRTGGREALPSGREVIRRARDRATGGRMTERELKRQVDEHAELQRHERHAAETEAAAQARQATKGRPRHEREQTVADAVETAAEGHRVAAQEKFGRTFGATQRPEVSMHEVDAARATREAAEARKQQAVKDRKAADKAHREALNEARLEQEQQAGRTGRLAGEVTERARGEQRTTRARQRGEARVEATYERGARALERQQEIHRADVGFERAHAGARVSVAKPKRTPQMRAAEGTRKTAQKDLSKAKTQLRNELAKPVAKRRGVPVLEQRVEQARTRLGQASDAVRAERARTRGVAPREHDVLLRAMEEQQAARARPAGRVQAEALPGAERVTQHSALRRAEDAARAKLAEHEAALEQMKPGTPEYEALAKRADRLHDRLAGLRAAQTPGGVPGPKAQRLAEADRARWQARAAERTARDEAHQAKRAHIDKENERRAGGLVDAADEGRVFDHPVDAARVAKKLNEQAHELPTGLAPFRLDVREPGGQGKPVTLKRGEGSRPLTFRVQRIGEDRYAVVPAIAKQRLYGGGGRRAELSHASVGTSKATGSKLLRTSRRAFTQSVLPLSPKWLAGQGAEAGIRAAVAGAGPLDLIRFNRTVKRMNELKAGSGDEFAARVMGGHYDPAGAVAAQINPLTHSLAEEYAGTPTVIHTGAKAASLVGQTLPMRLTRAGWGRYSRGVIGGVNAFIENNARKAMAGQALKQGPLMEKRILGLTDRAIDDAARGLQGTEHQIHAAREVDSMYGRYSKWSPEMRSLLMHWTPFLPWYLNTAKFLFHTLPAKHPVKAALLADISKAEEEWRKSKKLSFYGKEHVPGFLLGSYPTGKDRYLRVGHYTPWGVGADPAEATADLLIPQVVGPMKNLAGVDWKWQRLTKKDPKTGKLVETSVPEHILRAGVTAAEAQIPGVSQVGKITGVTPRYVDKKTDVGTWQERLKSYSPTEPTKSTEKKKKGKRKRSSSGFGGPSGFGGGFGPTGF